MGAVNYEHIRVNGYNIQSIKKMQIKNSINNHATLKLTGILDHEDINDVYSTTNNKVIEVYYENKGSKNTLFYGIVTNINVLVDQEVYKIDVEAKSMTYLLDIKVKSRSFQDKSMPVKTIIKNVMSDYSNSSYLLNMPDEASGELIVQYEETDWEFIKRIVSEYNKGLIASTTSKSIQYSVGSQNHFKQLSLAHTKFEIYKDLNEYKEMKENFISGAKEEDYLTYKVTDYGILSLGDYINFQNKQLYVYESLYEIKDGILQNTYKLRQENGLNQKRLFNTKIIGSSIDGKIIGVQGELVQIHLEIDKSQSTSTAKWFKFSTMSASSDGSGWYCMPEIGDSVKVYFPTKDEDESFAISAVSGYKQGASESGDRMGNPDNKYLRTRNDKEVKLTPDGIAVSCDSGQADMKLSSDGTLTISSQNNINVTAKGNIKIEAKKSFKISALESINIDCDKGGGLDFDKEGQIKEKGTQVNNN